jgi:hypothetical protein
MICLSDAANVATCAEFMFSPIDEDDEKDGERFCYRKTRSLWRTAPEPPALLPLAIAS